MFLCDMMPRIKCQLFLWAGRKNDSRGGNKERNKKDQYSVIRIRFFLNLVGEYHHTSGNDTESPAGAEREAAEKVLCASSIN